MDKRLKYLFDFQHFQQNARLKSVIQTVENQYGRALSDDDLLMVNAAGEAHVPPEREQAGALVGALMVPEGEEP